MSNNKMIFKCKSCGLMYCGECGENKEWENFCSTKCEEDYEKDFSEKIEYIAITSITKE